MDYTFELYQQGIDELEQKILESNIKYDYVVGIVRGGAIPAIQLSHRLGIPARMLHWQTRDGDENDHLMLRIIAEDFLAGKNILLVDDIVDSGHTINEITCLVGQMLEAQDADINETNRFNTAALVTRTTAKHQPNFFHIKDPEGWVDFFWEK